MKPLHCMQKKLLILNRTISVRNHLCANKLAITHLKIAVTHLKIELPTNYSITNHMYNHLTVCKQMSDVKLNF